MSQTDNSIPNSSFPRDRNQNEEQIINMNTIPIQPQYQYPPVRPFPPNFPPYNPSLPPLPLSSSLPPYPENQPLSTTSKIFLLSLIVIGIILLSDVWPVGVSFPLMLLPSYILYYYARQYSTIVQMDFLIKIYAAGFYIGSFLVLIVETILALLFGVICFSDQLEEWKQEISNAEKARRPADFHVRLTVGYFVFLFLISYIVAGLVEETMKYQILNRMKNRRPGYNYINGILLFAVAAALGFSTLENIGYIYRAGSDAAAANNKMIDNGVIASVFTECISRILISTPFHCATAYLIGLNVIKRDVMNQALRAWQILSVPVLFHGTFDFALFLIYTFQSDMSEVTSAILSIIIALSILILLLLYIRYQKRTIVPHSFLPLGQQDDDSSQPPSANGSGPGSVGVGLHPHASIPMSQLSVAPSGMLLLPYQQQNMNADSSLYIQNLRNINSSPESAQSPEIINAQLFSQIYQRNIPTSMSTSMPSSSTAAAITSSSLPSISSTLASSSSSSSSSSSVSTLSSSSSSTAFTLSGQTYAAIPVSQPSTFIISDDIHDDDHDNTDTVGSSPLLQTSNYQASDKV